MKNGGWGFDTRAMDRSVRPQDDFYRYANGAWLARTKIPKTESRWGSFMILRYETEKRLRAILTDVARVTRATPGSPEQLVRDFYISAMDMRSRNALGAAPLAPYLRIINAVKDRASLERAIALLARHGMSVPWGVAVDQDSKHSERYILHFYQSGLGMPDRDYYLKGDPEFERVRTAYAPFIERMWRFIDPTPGAGSSAARAILKIETALATVSMTKEDARDADKTYHKMSIAELRRHAPVDWARYFSDARIPRVPSVIVMQPDFLLGAAKLLSAFTPEEWRLYLAWHVLTDAAPYLSKEIVKENFSFYGTVLTGQRVMRPPWRRALSALNASIGFALGKLYVKRHFGSDARRKMRMLVKDLFDAYEARIRALDWMSPSTRAYAIRKLRAISRKIGYPSRWRSYRGLRITPDDFFGNVVRAAAHARARDMRKLAKPVDRFEWHMTPQTVNAYCSFTLNEIVFPAAILQHPFFDATNDDAVNYGAIGSVIGHELTHAFDDQGSKFDARGNMRSWWTAADRKRFDKKTAVLVAQYNAYAVDDGVHVNGTLTLGENIADLGGAVIAFDALKAHLKKTGRRNIAGFTPEQRFFLGFAQQEQEIRNPEMQKTSVLTDPHSPAEFRINGPLPHVDGFYEAFDVKPGDALYLEPSARVRIW